MIELNDNNFKQEIKNREFVIADFYATWCGPCGMQAKVLEEIQESRSFNADIVKVNVDEAPSLSLEYGIDAIPTLMIFKNNKLVKRIVGYTNREELLKIIDSIQE